MQHTQITCDDGRRKVADQRKKERKKRGRIGCLIRKEVDQAIRVREGISKGI